jgi:sterol desaturase/sphingolipid hydroxylase (fatty acid hydroxylase superfamily)
MTDFLAHLRDPVLLATPVFLLFVAVEVLAVHVLGHDDNVLGYSARDTRTSMSMGTVALVVNGFYRLVMLFVFAALYELTPLKLDPHDWWTWVAMLLGQELVFYAYHRASHRVRLLWAGHQVHHSSEHYNFSTALRQKWTPYFQLPFWSVLALAGIPPWMILTGLSIDLVYQFFVHTEKIGKLPRWAEFVFNTPSHHRVHHGSDAEYLDANYGGTLIALTHRCYRRAPSPRGRRSARSPPHQGSTSCPGSTPAVWLRPAPTPWRAPSTARWFPSSRRHSACSAPA